MALIQITPPATATGGLAEVYREAESVFGRVPNVLQIQSASPALLANRWAAVRYFFEHPTLSRALQATIRLLVSDANDCAYCVDFNAAILINLCGWTPDQVAATRQDATKAPLPDAEKSLLSFTLKSLHTPAAVAANDIAALHASGWTDRDALDAVTLAATNRATDMILNTFKIERDF